MSAGRHYGLATKLLDFTVDPGVAVLFANGTDVPQDDHKATLFILRHADAFRSHGGRILLPPPFVRRLHEQRGLFLELPSSRAERRAAAASMKVDFHPDPSFAVVRRGRCVDILPPNIWLDRAAKWARHWGYSNDRFPQDDAAKSAVLDWACEVLDCETFLDPREVDAQLGEWLRSMVEIMTWIMIRVAISGDGYYVDRPMWEAIRRDNIHLIKAFMAEPKLIQDHVEFSQEAELVEVIYTFLSSSEAWDGTGCNIP